MTERSVTIRVDVAGGQQSAEVLEAVHQSYTELTATVAKQAVNLQVNGEDHIKNLIKSIEQARATAAKPIYYSGSSVPTAAGQAQARKVVQQAQARQAAVTSQMATVIEHYHGRGNNWVGRPADVYAPGKTPKLTKPIGGEPLPFRDLGVIGGALAGKQAAGSLKDYQSFLGNTLQVGKTFGSAIGGALKSATEEFHKQKDLAKFWGTSGYISQGVTTLKSSLTSFLSSGGAGFTSWLQGGISNLEKYRLALAGASLGLMALAANAAMTSKTAENYISSAMSALSRKVLDTGQARKWVESAQNVDWSAGRESRMGTYETVINKTRLRGTEAQTATEDIEKLWFSRQEEFKRKGYGSAEALANALMQEGKNEDLDALFGLGFSTRTTTGRMGRISALVQDTDMQGAVDARPDVVLQKRMAAGTAAMGDAVLPVLNKVLGGFLMISDAVGKIPGLGAMMGWAAVIGGAALAGLTMLSVIGSLIPGLVTMTTLIRSSTVAHYASAAAKMAEATASNVAAVATKLLGVSISSMMVMTGVGALLVLAAVLLAVAWKTGYLQKAWDKFTHSSIGKGVFAGLEWGKQQLIGLMDAAGKAYDALDQAFAKGGGGGAIKTALSVILPALLPVTLLLKPLLIIVDYISKLWNYQQLIRKGIDSGLTLWKRMVEFLNWLLTKIGELKSWLISAIPGAEKEVKRQEMVKQEGYEKVEYKEKHGVHKAGYYSTETKQPTEVSSKLSKLRQEYTDLPGFAEGVEQAVREGMSGVSEGIKSAIEEGFKNIPGMEGLAETLGNLQTVLSSLQAWIDEHLGNTGHEGDTPLIETETGSAYKGAGGGYDIVFQKEWGTYQPGQQIQGTSWENVQKALGTTEAEPAMASGGQIKATGSLIGHSSEEVDPASVVVGGKTTLAKINEIISGTGSFSAGSVQNVNINGVSVTLNVDKLDNNTDTKKLSSQLTDDFLDQLVFRLRNKLDGTSTRSTGYLRGGT